MNFDLGQQVKPEGHRMTLQRVYYTWTSRKQFYILLGVQRNARSRTSCLFSCNGAARVIAQMSVL